MQAAELNPDPSTIQRHTAFITLLASKRSDLAGGGEGSSIVIKKMVVILIDIVTHGQGLVGINKSCVSAASGDINAYLAKDGTRILKSGVQIRKELLKKCDQFQVLANQIKESVNGGANATTDLMELLDWMMPPPQFASELTCEAFDDIVARRCSQHVEALMQHMGSLQAALNDHLASRGLDTSIDHFTAYSVGETSWKHGLSDSCTPEEILEAAKGSVLAHLPIKAMKEYCTAIEKEPWSCYMFQDHSCREICYWSQNLKDQN